MSIDKYIGRMVTIIYLDKKGQITKRLIRVRSIENGKVMAFDEEKKQPRLFELDRILAMQPVKRNAS